MDRAAFLDALRARAADAHAPRLVEGVDIGGPVYVRPLLASEWAKIVDAATKTDGINARIKGVALVLCDADGNRMIDPTSSDEMELIGGLPADDLVAIISAALPVPKAQPPVTNS